MGDEARSLKPRRGGIVRIHKGAAVSTRWAARGEGGALSAVFRSVGEGGNRERSEAEHIFALLFNEPNMFNINCACTLGPLTWFNGSVVG